MEKTRIMVVEDESLTGAYIEMNLENLGYFVTGIELSGKEAIEKAESERPDLVLMDITLQGDIDGIEAAHVIGTDLNIPVVYITANSDEKTLERAKVTEPYGYIVKPFGTRELQSNIEMALYRHKMERKLKDLAHNDSLTGLPNRTLFMERLKNLLLIERRGIDAFALGYIDLDGFKNINDTMGHDTGDLLLREVAERLRGCIRSSDTVSRLGGDEFTVLIRNLHSPSGAVHTAEKIIHALSRPFRIGMHNCNISASVGLSLYPANGTDAETLLKKADMAMYMAKKSGKNCYRLYIDELSEDTR